MLDHIAVRSDVRAHDAPADYTSSFRANAACARELARLYDEIAESLTDGRIPADAKITEEPVVRRSPARCLVQLGPVALTVAWLQRSQGTVADGELLVVVWRGEVAVRTPQGFERAHQHSGATSATALWETVLTVSAQSETQWGWAPAAGGEAVSSAALARRCVDRLRAALAECAP
ncbi:MAG TPA: hypothetical protein VNN72_16185 [Polyangiaceae bacterium]|nr:hypothetical protein [Polyangiaceae bacterium]